MRKYTKETFYNNLIKYEENVIKLFFEPHAIA